MNPKNPPLLKWYDPGSLEEPPDIAEIMDELGYLDIMPKEKSENTEEL